MSRSMRLWSFINHIKVAYFGRKSKIKLLRQQIEDTSTKLAHAREFMIQSNFDLKDIQAYNDSLSELGCLNLRLEHELRHMKPQQYMDEIKLPGNISF